MAKPDETRDQLASVVEAIGASPSLELLAVAARDIGHELPRANRAWIRSLSASFEALLRDAHFEENSPERAAASMIWELVAGVASEVERQAENSELRSMLSKDVAAALVSELAGGPQSQRTLVERVRKDPSVVSRRLAELRDQLVVADDSDSSTSADGRLRFYRLTALGHQLAEEAGLVLPRRPGRPPLHELREGEDFRALDDVREELLVGLRERVSWKSPSPDRVAAVSQLIGFEWSFGVAFVVPPLVEVERAAVAMEDVYALEAISKTLARATPPATLDAEIVAPQDLDGDQRNLLLVCSVRRNAVTRAVLDSMSSTFKIECDFQPYEDGTSGRERWALRFDGALIKSPSYEEEYESEASELHDYALLARVPNPWNGKAKVWIFAGLRAFGTLGAAQYLKEHADQLADDTKGGDFAAVVDVTRRRDDRRVVAEKTAHFCLLYP